MTDIPRETRVLHAVVSLVDSLLDDFDVVELLTDLTERCTQLLDISAAGLLLADPHRHLHLMAATSQRSRELELFQLQADEGPCLDCYAGGEPISIADLTTEHQRWPRFAPAAAEAGFVSVHAVPVRAVGTPLGALGLFGSHAGNLDDADLLVAQSLAHIASVAILQEHSPTPTSVPSKLHTATTNQIVVEQAKGYLREHFDIPVAHAFALLRRHAHFHGVHLTDLARSLISDPDDRPGILAAMERLASSQQRP